MLLVILSSAHTPTGGRADEKGARAAMCGAACLLSVDHVKRLLLCVSCLPVPSERGIDFFERDQNEQAQREFETAVALQPQLPVAHYNLGVLLKEKMNKAAEVN